MYNEKREMEPVKQGVTDFLFARKHKLISANFTDISRTIFLEHRLNHNLSWDRKMNLPASQNIIKTAKTRLFSHDDFHSMDGYLDMKSSRA